MSGHRGCLPCSQGQRGVCQACVRSQHGIASSMYLGDRRVCVCHVHRDNGVECLSCLPGQLNSVCYILVGATRAVSVMFVGATRQCLPCLPGQRDMSVMFVGVTGAVSLMFWGATRRCLSCLSGQLNSICHVCRGDWAVSVMFVGATQQCLSCLSG